MALFDSKTSAGECVLFVASNYKLSLGNSALLAAQECALKLKVPFAIVYCARRVSRSKVSARQEALERAEDILNTLSIPLMVIVGDPSDSLSAVLHHTKPAAVFFDLNLSAAPLRLAKSFIKNTPVPLIIVRSRSGGRKDKLLSHPYSWPGTIIKVTDVMSC